MKKWFNKIDPLIVFFLLSLITLFSFVGDIDYFLPNNQKQSFRYSNFKIFVDAEFVFNFPKQGLVSENEKLINYNSDYKLLYSTDGGKSYQTYKNEPLLELKPNDLINKVTSIRSKSAFGEIPKIISILVKAEHKDGKTFTKPKQLTYFKDYNSNLPLINLTINEKDLFDTYSGVMNLGEMSWSDNGFYNKPWERNANYSKRGVLSKKRTIFQFFKANNLAYETTSFFQVSGNATRSFPQKSIKLKSIQTNKFEYAFFKSKGLKKYKSVVLRQSGNDNTKTLFADLLMQNLASELPILTQKGFPVNIFINGNYWGIYNLRERYDTYMIGKKENVNPEKVTILEDGAGTLKKGRKNVQNKFIGMIDSIYKVKEIKNESYNYFDNKIDVQSFTYYILLETYYGNLDWLNNNVMWYKADKNKWKWLLNDLDYSLAYNGSKNINENYFSYLKKSKSMTGKLFNILMKDKKFIKYFKKNSVLFYKTYLTNNRILKEYNKLKESIEPNIVYHTNRWRGNFSKSEWEQNCKSNLEFLLKRRSVCLNQIDEL